MTLAQKREMVHLQFYSGRAHVYDTAFLEVHPLVGARVSLFELEPKIKHRLYRKISTHEQTDERDREDAYLCL